MGIKERKERHREDLRQAILDAAKKLFMKHGYEATTIRKIAAEIEFSPTTIYLYYKDKNDILYALQKEGFILLGKSFHPLMQVDDPYERLKAMGRTFIQFSLENSEFYELMFVMKEPLLNLDTFCVNGQDVDWEEGIAAFDFLLHTVEDLQRIGYFKGQDTKIISLWIWATVHGLCTLQMHGHLEHVARHKLEGLEPTALLPLIFGSFVQFLEKVK
ncbi:transcriptional regulator, TetR family [bacterium A37T11]|nr:transcriptional regulator, TetR family [bacterium A37T11]